MSEPQDSIVDYRGPAPIPPREPRDPLGRWGPATLIVCSLVRGWLGSGLGVLYSMFVGIMIWLVSCFAHFEV